MAKKITIETPNGETAELVLGEENTLAPLPESSTAILAPLTPEELAELSADYPQEEGYTKRYLPVIKMVGKDEKEKVFVDGEELEKVVHKAGQFYSSEKVEGETVKTYLTDQTVEVIVIHHRYFLSYYDNALGSTIKSFSYDLPTDVTVLRRVEKTVKPDGSLEFKSIECGKGTREELQKKYPWKEAKNGRKNPELKECKELIVLRLSDMKLYSMPLNATSSWAYSDYLRDIKPSENVTAIGFEKKVNGTTEWVQNTYKKVRPINREEFNVVRELKKQIREAMAAERAQYGSGAEQSADATQAEADFKDIGGESVPLSQIPF
jgi:hypothetical protein